MQQTILIIEDDPTISLTMEFALKKAGYAVSSASNGLEGLGRAKLRKPDLVLLDIMLPGANGFEVATELRKFDVETPIIMLTALDRDEDKIRGLDAGADDYITKPFSVDVLLARIRANMRRANLHAIPSSSKLEYGDLEVDPVNSCVKIKGRIVQLRTKEYELLVALASRPGALCQRQWLTREVWGEDFLPTSRTIDVHIRRIRKAIEEPSSFTFIHTVHGMGYRFEPTEKNLTRRTAGNGGGDL